MPLANAFKLLAKRFQEASNVTLSHSNIRQQVCDAVSEKVGGYCYVVDIFGDDQSGDVIYTSGWNGQVFRAKYELSMENGKRATHLGDPVDVLPRIIYDEEADEADEYVSQEAIKEKLYTDGEAPLCERFVSKSARDKADSSSFAGKGKSFPILKKDDVMAAVRSIPRAGTENFSASTIKANITRIAKAKGWGDALPGAWKGEETKPAEAEVKPEDSAAIQFMESAAFAEALPKFTEATKAANPLVKIISPGRGSSGWYSEELLKRDGPKIFKRGTLMYVNHATESEQAERPEGDWSKLAGVLTEDAYYDPNGKAGSALYAKAKIFSDYQQQVEEKAAHTGVSIRAGGFRDDKKNGPDGKPGVITELTNAESVDLVTKAGRDGKILLESATAEIQKEEDMDEAKMLEAIGSAVKVAVKEATAPLAAENKRLLEKLETFNAPKVVKECLAGIRLPEATLKRLYEKFTSESIVALLPMKEGKLDVAEIGKLIEADAKRESQYLMEMGYSDTVMATGTRMTAEETAAASQEAPKQISEAMGDLASIMLPDSMGEKSKGRESFLKGRAA